MRVFVTWRPCIYHVCINHDSFPPERNGLLMRKNRLKCALDYRGAHGAEQRQQEWLPVGSLKNLCFGYNGQ